MGVDFHVNEGIRQAFALGVVKGQMKTLNFIGPSHHHPHH
jgi:hypothetical protein